MMYLQSNDPNNYNTVEFVSSISKEEREVEYRVVSLSTTANFSLTSDGDYISFSYGGNSYKINFTDTGSYDIETLNKIMSSQFLGNASVKQNDRGLIEIHSDKEIVIENASHRVQLLFGIYHNTFPIRSSQMDSEYVIVSNSIPYFTQGQVLYLLSRTDAICLTNARGSEESQSIAYKVHELIYNGLPIVSINNGNWFKIKSSQLQQLKFTLVDFMLEPVILHSPLYLTVEVLDNRTTSRHPIDNVVKMIVPETN